MLGAITVLRNDKVVKLHFADKKAYEETLRVIKASGDFKLIRAQWGYSVFMDSNSALAFASKHTT